MNGFTLHAPPGQTLLRALLRLGVDVPHDCGGVMACTSCRIIVRDGSGQLSAPDEDEIDLLERYHVERSGARLACQAVSKGGDFTLELVPQEIPRPSAIFMAAAPLTVTRRAADHFAAQLARNPACNAVRLSVKPAGCSGLRYAVELVRDRGSADALFETAGIAIVVDVASLPHLQGTRIDLVSEGLGVRLDFRNPNALDACGCGKSFRIEHA